MQVPGTALQQLNAFKARLKFAPDDMYMGVAPPEMESVLDAVLNQSADDFAAVIAAGATPAQYLQALSAGLAKIDADKLDTEDRERVAGLYEELMDIVGLESSDGLLNSFVYGAGLGNILSGKYLEDDE